MFLPTSKNCAWDFVRLLSMLLLLLLLGSLPCPQHPWKCQGGVGWRSPSSVACMPYSSLAWSVEFALEGSGQPFQYVRSILGSAGCVLPGGVPSLAFAIHIPPWRGRWSCPWRQPYCILLLQIRPSGLGFRFLLLFWGCRCCCFCCYCRNY